MLQTYLLKLAISISLLVWFTPTDSIYAPLRHKTFHQFPIRRIVHTYSGLLLMYSLAHHTVLASRFLYAGSHPCACTWIRGMEKGFPFTPLIWPVSFMINLCYHNSRLGGLSSKQASSGLNIHTSLGPYDFHDAENMDRITDCFYFNFIINIIQVCDLPKHVHDIPIVWVTSWTFRRCIQGELI